MSPKINRFFVASQTYVIGSPKYTHDECKYQNSTEEDAVSKTRSEKERDMQEFLERQQNFLKFKEFKLNLL